MIKNYTLNGANCFLRVLSINGRLWVYPVDVAYSLGYTRPYEAVKELIRPGCIRTVYNGGDGEPTTSDMICDLEGLFEMLDETNKPDVEGFKAWFFDSVLYDAIDEMKKDEDIPFDELEEEQLCQNQF